MRTLCSLINILDGASAMPSVALPTSVFAQCSTDAAVFQELHTPASPSYSLSKSLTDYQLFGCCICHSAGVYG
jgi:hypothetical protein